MYMFSHINDLPVTARSVQEATKNDALLSRALDYTMNGWPEKVSDPDLRAYRIRAHKVTCALKRNSLVLDRFRSKISFIYKRMCAGFRLTFVN